VHFHFKAKPYYFLVYTVVVVSYREQVRDLCTNVLVLVMFKQSH